MMIPSEIPVAYSAGVFNEKKKDVGHL